MFRNLFWSFSFQSVDASLPLCTFAIYTTIGRNMNKNMKTMRGQIRNMTEYTKISLKKYANKFSFRDERFHHDDHPSIEGNSHIGQMQDQVHIMVTNILILLQWSSDETHKSRCLKEKYRSLIFSYRQPSPSIAIRCGSIFTNISARYCPYCGSRY